MAVTQKQRGPGRHDPAHPEVGSRLAHWPPPFRGGASKPIILMHPPGETPKRASLRGWRLTRAMFSEFEED